MITISSIFEMLFLIGFGLSWPMNIVKDIRGKTSKGKSLMFLVFALFAYACGILSKLTAETISFVLIFYIINAVMVVIDTIFWFVNHKRDLMCDAEGQVCVEVVEEITCPYGYECERLAVARDKLGTPIGSVTV